MQSFYINVEFKYILKDKTIGSVFQTRNGQWNKYNTFKDLNYDIVENYSSLLEVVQDINENSNGHNRIEILEPNFETPIITIIFYGSVEFIEGARLDVLQKYNQISFKTIELTPDQLNKVNDGFLNKLIQISETYGVEIIINQNQIQIIGNHDNITIVETQTRVLIDSMINNCIIDSVSVNLSLVPILGDRGLFNFKEIAKQSNTNIYLPDLLPEIFNSQIYSTSSDFKIWISGSEVSQVINGKKILEQLVAKLRDGELYTKTMIISKEKLSLITMLEQSQLMDIMFDNGSFITWPSFGSDGNEIVIQSNSIDSIDETINQINILCCKIYKVLVNTNVEYDSVVRNMIKKFKVLVKTNSNGLEVIGNNNEVKNFLRLIDYGKCKCSMTIEIGNDQKDFISGKKNGKILKILNQFGSNFKSVIKFLPLNEYNFLINLILPQSTLHEMNSVIELLENELPSEFKFNIPEIFHKSIIGNAGSIIQSIMKKYNVYIKFSSQPTNTNLYSFRRFNNVLIKCPTKNSKNIKLVEIELNKLVLNCGNNNLNYNYLSSNSNNSIYNSINFKLLKSHYLLLVNNFKINNLNNLEIEFSSYINWPKSIEEFIQESLNIEIKGSDIKMKFFINKLVSMLPNNFKFIIPKSSIFTQLVESEPFNKAITNLKIFYNIETSFFSGENHEIWLSFFEDADINLAINTITDLLNENNVPIIGKMNFEFNPVEQSFDDIKFKKSKKPLNRITNEV